MSAKKFTKFISEYAVVIIFVVATVACIGPSRLSIPYIVQEIRGSNESVLSTHQPVVRGQAMTQANAATLAEMMTHVIKSGTGTAAQISGMTVGGKTGTAETSVGGGDHSWFTGYIAEKHVAVAVYLATETTTTATPIARSIMEALP